MKITEAIDRLGMEFETELVESNPNMADMPYGSTHWLCKLTRHGQDPPTLEIHFSMGPAHCHEPTAEDVLDCLASDATIYENDEIDDLELSWRQGKAIETQTLALREWAGDMYEALLWETERL